MSARKTIQINPDFLKLSGKGKTRRKKEKKEKRKDLRMSIKPNNIKKKLMAKIKEHQKQKADENVAILSLKKDEEAQEKFTKDFNKQIDYLEKIIGNKKEKERKKKKRKRTRKRPDTVDSNTSEIKTPISTSSINIPAAPPYGCLKNGTKPTYSQYKKTLKVREKISFTDEKIVPNLVPKENTREDKLNKLKKRLATPKKAKPIQRLVSVKKTIKIYKLGKNKKDGNIGVLVKSGKTRRLIRKEHEVLRKKCVSEIKSYLRKHNLIKIGSSAPESVLRQIYEDSFLAGNIYNKNPDNLLHNYLNDETFN
jgi:hypothetical protein